MLSQLTGKTWSVVWDVRRKRGGVCAASTGAVELRGYEERTAGRDARTGAAVHTAATLAAACGARRAAVARGTGCGLEGLARPGARDAGAALAAELARAHGVCCENVVGFVTLPVGVAGPLCVDGAAHYVPLATAEGALVASTARGAKALTAAGGVRTALSHRGQRMTRAPLVAMPDVRAAARLCAWVESPAGRAAVADAVRASSRHARLRDVRAVQAGRLVWLRLALATGDAMGMNMATLAATRVLAALARRPECAGLRPVAVSGNLCADKKPAAVNALLGRGRHVAAEARVPRAVLARVLRCPDARVLARLCARKCWLGSGLAGALPGGMNAHAANIVAAVFAATGQDLAQVVESANCVTVMEAAPDGAELVASCTMPSLELGTLGGGTRLGPQRTCISLMTTRVPMPRASASPSKGGDSDSHHKEEEEEEEHKDDDYEGARGDLMARVLCSAVLAGELSLLAALARGELAASHLKLNRPK